MITQEMFTGLASQILTYLGYAVTAGLSVLVAVLGAQRAWRFARMFLDGEFDDSDNDFPVMGEQEHEEWRAYMLETEGIDVGGYERWDRG